MKIIVRILALCVFFTSGIVNAALITVIGDVDAITTNSRAGNISLLDNVRGTATDILWLTAGGSFTYRDTDIRSRWGVSTDTNSAVTSNISNRDLIVVSASWAQNFTFDSSTTTALVSYLATGGNMLFVGQVCGGCNGFDPLNMYNNFLTSMGSSIRYDNDTVDAGNYLPNQSTTIGSGATQFRLSGVTRLLGGQSVVQDTSGRVGVAFETISSVPVPAPATLTLFVLGLFRLACLRRKA